MLSAHMLNMWIIRQGQNGFSKRIFVTYYIILRYDEVQLKSYTIFGITVIVILIILTI